MKFAITGARDLGKMREFVKHRGIAIDQESPDFVLTYGGDGSILYAEREYPGIPKITVKASSAAPKSLHSVPGFFKQSLKSFPPAGEMIESHAFKCTYTEDKLEKVIGKVKAGLYELLEEMKLEAESGAKKALALNEIQLHNRSPVKAVRFSVFAGEKPVFENVIGDGVVVSTPFGSTAYYSSVGGRKFAKGIGICLNNPHKFTGKRFKVVDSAAEIRIRILRDEGEIYSDNSPEKIGVKQGDEIAIRRAKNAARFVAVK